MKMLRILLVLTCCAYANDPVENIYQRASELVANDVSEKEDEELLFEFYSEEIAKIDEDTLQKNPELLFRRGVAWLLSLGSLEEIISQLPKVREDFQFVLDHAEKESRLFAAAQLKNERIDAILEASPESLEEFGEAWESFNEKKLRQWAINPLASGKELREDVYLNVRRDPKIAASFYEYALLSEDEPEVALGYIEPKVEMIGILPDEEGGAALAYKIEYHTRNGGVFRSVTITTEL